MVTIFDDDPPTIEDCTDPPIFLTADSNGANITWDEPNIFDNSNTVTVSILVSLSKIIVATIIIE